MDNSATTANQAETAEQVIITPPALASLPKASQRRIWENWRRQRISLLTIEFEAMTGVNPKSLQE